MFSPFLHSSYYDPSYYYNPYNGAHSQRDLVQAAQQRALAQKRQKLLDQQLRRSQYLPHEDIDDDLYYENTPRQRLYLDSLKRQQTAERLRREYEDIYNQRRLEANGRKETSQKQDALERGRLTEASSLRQKAHNTPAASSVDSDHSHHPIQIPIKSPAPPSVTGSMSSTTSMSLRREKQETAASKIQTTFRIYRAFRSLNGLEDQFNSLLHAFSLPTQVDFETSEGVVSIHPPSPLPLSSPASETLNIQKLSYNSTNFNLHSYIESLNRLLLKLDSIQSWGNATVRSRRRQVVAKVEAEAARIELWWKQAWVIAQQQQHLEEEQKVELEDESMDEDKQTKEDDVSSDSDDFHGVSETVAEEDASSFVMVP